VVAEHAGDQRAIAAVEAKLGEQAGQRLSATEGALEGDRVGGDEARGGRLDEAGIELGSGDEAGGRDECDGSQGLRGREGGERDDQTRKGPA
jgi:hypothetical protein